MFGQEAKVNGHLFLHCMTTTNLWNIFVCILGVNMTIPKTTFEVPITLARNWKEMIKGRLVEKYPCLHLVDTMVERCEKYKRRILLNCCCIYYCRVTLFIDTTIDTFSN